MWSKVLFVGGLMLVGFFAFIVWAKVPSPTKANTVVETGKLVSVSSPCCNDVVLLLEGDDHVYYINHGVEMDLGWKQWGKMSEGEDVHIHWIRTNWNPFNANGSHRPVARVDLANRMVFNLIPASE